MDLNNQILNYNNPSFKRKSRKNKHIKDIFLDKEFIDKYLNFKKSLLRYKMKDLAF